MSQPRGIFVGLSTVDVVYSVEEFPKANSKVVARSQDVYVGGPATNASATYAHLGGEATLVSVVGRHALATVIREELDRHSISSVDLNPQFEDLPPISSICVDSQGARNIVSANSTRVVAPAAAVVEGALESAKVLLVDGHYMQACQTWAAAAHSREIPVAFDGGSWKSGTEELLKSVDVAICSADFMPPGCATYEHMIEYLQKLGVAKAAITNGPDPIIFTAGTVSGRLSVPKVEVLDTAGAGDIFHGAFCYYFSSGCGFVEALSMAAEVAAESCRFRGTREWMYHLSPATL